MSETQLRQFVLEVVTELAGKGPAWSQEGVVMRAIRDRLKRRGEVTSRQETGVLDAWHDLFTEKKLGWGLDFDNPGKPFFHVRSAPPSGSTSEA